MEVKLSDVCRIQYGFAFDSAQFSTTTGIPLIRIRDVVRGYSETYTTEECGEEYLVNDGDLLIGMDGEFNIARWQGGQALLNQRVCRLFPSEKINPGYLFYFMPQALRRIEEQTPFVTVKHLSAKQLNSISIPLPELGEQQHIATVLDKISGLISLRKQQLAKLDELVNARFVEMFGDLKNNTFRWKTSTVGQACYYIKDGPHKSPPYVDKDKGIPFISTRNIVNGDGIDWSTAKYISEKDYQECIKKCNPQKGNILYSKGGTTGIAKLVETDRRFANWVHVAVLKFGETLDGKFFECMLNTNYCYTQSQHLTKGIANRDFVLSAIAQVKIVVPPIELQQQYAFFVRAVEKSKLTIHQSLGKLEMLKNALMQEYFI